MAKLKLEASWREEFKRVDEAQSRDRSNGGLFEDPKRQASLRWRGDEARLRYEQTHHYFQWTSVAVVAAVIVSLVMIGLTFLH